MASSQRVVYIPPTCEFKLLDSRTRHSTRSSTVHSLLLSTGLAARCSIYPLREATLAEAQLAHTKHYLSVLHAASSLSDDVHVGYDDTLAELEPCDLTDLQTRDDLLEEAGLVDDCAPFPGVWKLAMLTVGGAAVAARALAAKHASIACWFDGGRHHATADSANGFCYLNDAVVACKLLLAAQHIRKVVYVDIDVHHGDGVEQSFLYNTCVTTVSLHLAEVGFFPNSGRDVFAKRGAGRTDAIRVPLRRGIGDKSYTRVFSEVMDAVLRRKKPDAIVMQCGCDGACGDPLGGFNLTTEAYVCCVRKVLSSGVPVLILGGGGYVASSAARVWADVLECCVDWVEGGDDGRRGRGRTRDIPMTDEHFESYRTSFSRDMRAMRVKDENTEDEVRSVLDKMVSEL